MSVREIEVFISGPPGSGAHAAARATARTMETAGASVDLRLPLSTAEIEGEALRGVRALVRVEERTPARTSSAPPPDQRAGAIGYAQVAKIGGGLVLLLVLFGAEVRLRFGFRLDLIVTLVGIWAFWRYCQRSSAAA